MTCGTQMPEEGQSSRVFSVQVRRHVGPAWCPVAVFESVVERNPPPTPVRARIMSTPINMRASRRLAIRLGFVLRCPCEVRRERIWLEEHESTQIS
jgi:hypothetical protein